MDGVGCPWCGAGPEVAHLYAHGDPDLVAVLRVPCCEVTARPVDTLVAELAGEIEEWLRGQGG